MKTYIVEEKNQILGTYIIKPNQIDLGSHIANCSYMVHPNAQGKGIGKLMYEHSIKNANQLGFKAIQFNIVVSTNINAVKLWEKYGFAIIGTIPNGFNHKKLGFVDAHIMYKEL
jgi:L-amino acid N-acyltransferase YncA